MHAQTHTYISVRLARGEAHTDVRSLSRKPRGQAAAAGSPGRSRPREGGGGRRGREAGEGGSPSLEALLFRGGAPAIASRPILSIGPGYRGETQAPRWRKLTG